MEHRESISLKWGSLNSWDLHRDETKAVVGKWMESGVCVSAMLHHDTEDQKALICELIDLIDGEIWNEWDGEKMSKDDAKRYVMEYGQ